MAAGETLASARARYRQQRWREAFAGFQAADRQHPLDPEDLESLGTAGYLVGEDDASTSAFERAHHGFLARDDVTGAVRAAFWAAFGLLNRAEVARGGGWLARAQRLADEHRLDTVERGYLLVPVGLRALDEGDPAAAAAAFGRALEIGERFGDPDLTAMSRLGSAEATILTGRIAEGLSQLDEVMVAVTTGEVSAVVAGTVYCAVILACRDAFELRGAREWTLALSRWCEAQPDLVPFRGQCLVHRSEIMQLQGAWADALHEAERARAQLSDPPHPAVGMAYYQLGELHRLRGRAAEAEQAYRDAGRWGRQPQPGLALLRLAQGEVDAAVGAIRRVLDDSRDALTRARMLSAAVEILLAAGDAAAARTAADELSAIAAAHATPLLEALARDAAGTVLLDAGEARAALTPLEEASARWHDLDAVHEHARTRVRYALACRALGDEDTAALELRAAHAVFDELGAAPDVGRVTSLLGTSAPPPVGLTPRQLEVLALVAQGRTNREIAAELVVSEHTVRRHLQNVFVKLGVSSRAAAVAHAIERGWV